MAPLTFAVLSGLIASTVATTASGGQITWGAVVYTYHGEKTPGLGYSQYNLSPLGANQLVDAGGVIRDRYVAPPANSIGTPINGLSTYAIENTQLSVESTDDEFVFGSAVAFMQGLYPPRHAYIIDGETQLGNGTVVQYPYDGYQYPNIGTATSLDFNSIWIAGNQDCTEYSISQVKMLSSDAYDLEVTNTAPFYNSLNSTIFSQLNAANVNYYNAYDLYEYALYQYNHNTTIFKTTDLQTLGRLQTLASQQKFQMNTGDSPTDIASIAGRSLAAKVMQQFNHIIASSGVSDKLTLLFGSYEPFLSFFSLSNLTHDASGAKFYNLPQHGSIMSFELFSNVDTFNSSSPYPSVDDLWVRFLFRNGTGNSSFLDSYSMFNRGPQYTDMSWADFAAGMGSFALTEVSDWCSECQSINLFCEAILANIDDGSDDETETTTTHGKRLSPVIGGVIGATVTIGLLIIFIVVLMLLGFRLDYHEKRAKGLDGTEGGIGVLKRNGSGGGYKGAEKLASDPDLRLKGGVGATVIRHERVGSWELNESPTSPTDRTHSSLDKEIESGRVVSTTDYGRRSEDGIEEANPFGDPVKPVDHI